MNFVYLHTHDSGRMMRPYGYACHTPALSALAAEGFLFRQAHCAGPTCSPSRAGMLMGMAPHNTGMLGLAHLGFSLNDTSKHLGHYLSEQGIYTAVIGVQHEAGRADHALLGYNEFYWNRLKTNEDTDYHHTEVAEKFLADPARKKSPFFLSFGLRCTHRPYPTLTTEETEQSAFVLPPHTVPDTPENRLDYRSYQKSISIADECVGRILRALKENGLYEDTAVLFTTDHGIAFPHMKCSLYDAGTGVALILRHPRMGHACSDALISHLDVYPTVCDVLGVPKPAWLQGHSMLPLMEALDAQPTQGEDHLNDYIFSEVTFHASYEPMRSVRSKTHKLIRYYFPAAEHRPPANTDDSAPKDLYFRTPLSRQARPREELFDLMADPCERINLVDNPSYAEEYATLSRVLDDWMQRTNDPLLQTVDPAELAPSASVYPPRPTVPPAKKHASPPRSSPTFPRGMVQQRTLTKRTVECTLLTSCNFFVIIKVKILRKEVDKMTTEAMIKSTAILSAS